MGFVRKKIRLTLLEDEALLIQSEAHLGGFDLLYGYGEESLPFGHASERAACNRWFCRGFRRGLSTTVGGDRGGGVMWC